MDPEHLIQWVMCICVVSFVSLGGLFTSLALLRAIVTLLIDWMDEAKKRNQGKYD